MIEPWLEIERKTHEAGRRRTMQDVTYRLPDGRRETFALFHMASRCAGVLAITEDRQIILARQYRPGPGVILDELPGGGIELGESADAAARRELLEETGYACASLEYLGRPHDCAYSTVERHAFLATGCHRVAPPRLDEGEDVEVVLKPMREFIDQLLAGQCTDLEIAWMGLFRAGIIGLRE